MIGIDLHAILLLVLGAAGSLVGWLLLRAVKGVDEKLTSMDGKLDVHGAVITGHGERLVRLETKAGLDAPPLPVPLRNGG